MSSNTHHNNQIDLGNYEEFFLLYIDRELSPAQMQMVETFLEAHPDLRAELDILKETTLLPEEGITLNKDFLLSHQMAKAAPDEELLLYIDNELDSKRKTILDLELAANPSYAAQLQSLLAAKLDPTEHIEHPNKKELYRSTTRIIAFKPWMRIAAAVILITGAAGTFYSINNNSGLPAETVAKVKQQPEPHSAPATAAQTTATVAEVIPGSKKDKLTATPIRRKLSIPSVQKESNETAKLNQVPQPTVNISHNDVASPVNNDLIVQVNTLKRLEANNNLINKSDVTKILAQPSDIVTPVEEVATTSSTVSNEKKGSVKGFLRKATRLIEKKTGIDPTNDGQLLIGIVAVNLK